MVQYQIKLRPCVSQEKLYNQWLFHLASVHNWAVRKIELNARNKDARNQVYFTKQDFRPQAVRSLSKLLPGIPPGPVRHVGAYLGPQVGQECR